MRIFSFLMLFVVMCTSNFSWAQNWSYDLESPVAIFRMPSILTEISALSMSLDGQHLIAVQDEEGDLFFLDKKNGKIVEEVPFWKDGDYEGVESVGDDIFVVKSSGTIYKICKAGKPNQEVEKFNTELNSDYDVEGLAYDKKNNQLLLACKAKAGEGSEYKRKKAIYGFSLTHYKLSVKPLFLISLEDVQDYLGTKPAIKKLEKIAEFFAPNESKFTFTPSGVAIHPMTEELFILSTAGRLLVILSPDGEIVRIERMKKSLQPQPEGICFDRDGSLFIASEGDGGTALISKYPYLK